MVSRRAGAATLLVVAAYGLFVLWRLNSLGGDPSAFVIAGPPHVDASQTPPNLHVYTPGYEYDGEFFYRLALDPFGNGRSAYGIELDEPAYRQQRILYPLIAWALSAGRWQLTPWALIVTNVLAVGALGYTAAAYAATSGRSVLVSLSAAFYPGYVVSVSRDLAELTEAALLVAGLLLVNQRRYRLASMALVAGVLARETLLVVPIAGVAVWGVRRFLFAERNDVPVSVWLAPIVAYAAWSGVLTVRWGTTLFSAGGLLNFGLPFQAVVQHVESIDLQSSRIWNTELPELGLIAFALVAVLLTYRVRLFESVPPLACVIAAVIGVSYSVYVWQDAYAYRRALHELFLTAVLALIVGATWFPRLLVAGTLPLWLWFAIQHGSAP